MKKYRKYGKSYSRSRRRRRNKRRNFKVLVARGGVRL